jgi:hypothetical protein
MANPKWLEKYLRTKPEVNRIFDDLEQYKDYCRLNMLRFDEKDLYKSEQFKKFEKYRNWLSRQEHRQ